MIAEHVFVTTLPEEQVNDRLLEFLAEIHPERVNPSMYASAGLGTTWTFVAKKLCRSPQSLHVEFDRGQVSIAASLNHNRGPEIPQHNLYLANMVIAIEQTLSHNTPPALALEPLYRGTRKIRKRNDWLWITAVILISLVIVSAVATILLMLC